MTEKTVNTRDITLGVLLIVLSLFPLYFAWYITNFISYERFLVDIVCILVYNKLYRIGYILIKGFNIYHV